VDHQIFLRLENISKSYQEGNCTRTILNHANSTFQEGELVAILGKSGSGKSTLLNLVSGIDLVDEGEIWLGGKNLTKLNDTQRTLFRRNNIGFIFQFFNLIPTLTVLENIVLPVELTGKSARQARQLAEPLLGAVELADRANTFPDRLSGGEQQRVAIARALINDPLLLLADEPTGNLDDQTGDQVLSLLDRLTRKAGKNMIMVTHNAQAASYADRIIRLHNGLLEDQQLDRLHDTEL
jgi:putative ABC transport system ATP-binding protein